MAVCFRKFLSPYFYNNLSPIACISIRKGHWQRGKPPGVAKSLEQKFSELNYKDPEIHFKVDIGLPPKSGDKRVEVRERVKVVKENRKKSELEKLSRNNELLVNLDALKEEHLYTQGPSHIKTIAEHYGVYQHLFGDAYFLPMVPMSVLYDIQEGSVPVYYGNIIKPIEAAKKPRVCFNSDENSLWTLILTNPDGHFVDQTAEYVHWFIGNIPGSDVERGETVIEYLQPFPPKGTGYHRLIFILYKQEKKLDFSQFKKTGPCLNLSDRTFKTLDFYKERQDDLTPASLSFFQCDWDKSLTDFYHKILQMREPIFEYDFPPPYIKPQKWFTTNEPFNLYMDKYRDPKQINKEFLMRKFKKVHPFKAPPPPLPYPNAKWDEGYVPSWLKLEKTKSRLKWGRINDIE